MNQQIDQISVNGIEYVRKDQVAAVAPTGTRAVVVVDRGWIFAGDVARENGRIRLSRAVWVFRWESVGFAAVVEDPKKSKADIRKLSTVVDIPEGAEIFSLPVPDSWGL